MASKVHLKFPHICKLSPSSPKDPDGSISSLGKRLSPDIKRCQMNTLSLKSHRKLLLGYVGVGMRRRSHFHDLGLVAELGNQPLVLTVHCMTLGKSSLRPQLLYLRLSIKQRFRIQILELDLPFVTS